MAGDVTVTFDAVLGGNAAVKLDAIKAQLQALTGKTHTITVNVDSKGFANQINKIMGNAKSGSGAILGNIGNKGMLGSIKRQTAELQTQKQLVSQMRSAAASAYKAIDHSTALTSGQKTRALERTVQLMNDLNRASNAIANGRYNTPRTMRDLSSQVKNTEQYVSRLKAAEKAAVRAAAAEEKRAAAMNKTWSDAAANKQKAITNQVTDAAKQLANYQSRYQSLLNSTYGGTAQGGRSLNELKEWMNFGQSLFKNAQRATPFNVKGTGALRDLTGVLGELSSMYSAVEARAKSFAAAERAANSRWASAETAKQKSIASQLAASMKGISNAEKLYQKLSNSPMAGNKSLQNFGQQIAQVKQMAEAAGKIKLYDPQGATKLNQLASAVTGLGASYANIKAKADAFTKSQRAALSESKAFTRQAGSMQKRIETFMGKNPRLAGTTYEQQLQNLIGGMQAKSKTGTGTLNNLRAVEQQFNSIKKAAADAGKTGQTFGQSIVGAVKQFGGWMLITHSIMKTIQTIKNMIGTVRDLDTAMTELRRVTHETSDTYDQFYQGATKRAVDIGATLKDTIQASADFVKLGYDIQDAPGLADAALVYKNVGIGIEDISDASNSIISAMKAFQLGPEEAMSVVDKFNLVGNNFAISSAGIGEAIERSASAMASAGNTLDETIALITAGNEVVQDPQKMGTTLKTLSMYLRASKTEAEDAGIETDGMAESVSKLREELMSLTGGKVDIMLDDDTFKSTYQILKELSQVWDDLTDINRANILEKIGGKRNANVSAAIITNFAQAEKALATSMNSAGSAMKENDKYLDSIEGRTAKFRATWQALSGNFFSTDFIKGVVSGTTAVASGFDGLIKKIGAIPTLMATITAAMSAFRLRQTGRTGIFDVVTNPKGPPSIRLFNSELKSLGGTIKDVYGTYYRQAGGGVKGAVASGIKSPFALMSASILGRGGQIREYNQLAKAYKDAQKAYQPYKGKTGAVAEAQKQNFKNAANSLAAYNTQLKASSSLWAQYANSVNKKATSINATFAGFTKWLAQNNKMGQAFFGTFTKGLAGVASMFGSAFVSAGISMAVMGVISLISKLIHHQEELRQKTRDSAIEFNQSQKSISDYAAEVAQINTKLSSGELSIEETVASRERLMAIQNELVSSYGSEASGLNLIAMSADEAAAALERLQKAEANRFLFDKDNQKGFEQARQAMETSGTNEFYGIGGDDTPKYIIDQLKSMSKEFDAFSFDELGNGAITLRVTADPQEAVDQIDAFMAEAEAKGIDLDKIEIGDGRTLNEAMVNARKIRQEVLSDYGESYDAIVKAEITANDKYLDVQNGILDAKDGLSSAITQSYSSDEERAQAVSEAIKGIYAAQDKLNQTDFSGEFGQGIKRNLTEQMDSVMSMIGDEELKADIELNLKKDSVDEAIGLYTQDVQDAVNTSFDEMYQNAPKKMKGVLDALKGFRTDTGEIFTSDILAAQVGDPAAWNALAAAADNYGVSVENLMQKLADAHVIQSDSTDLAYNANEKFKDLYSNTNSIVESQQLLNSIYESQEKHGSLSVSTYESLIKKHKEFGNMLKAEGSSITLNADAAQNLIDAQAKENILEYQQAKLDALKRHKLNKEAIDELEKSTRKLTDAEQQAHDAKLARLKAENEDIETAIAKSNIQIAQLESLTSAYSKWQVATQTANQDTMYNDMINAKKEIEEGLKLERFGRDEYQTAVRMLIPDAPSPYDKKAIKSYMDKLNRYITSDENGAITKTGMNNFLSDAVDAGLMTVEDGVHKVIDGIKPEDFVEKLKITPSMAKAIFGLLEDYGGEFTWTAEDFFHLENLEEAKNKINEVKEAFNEIDQNKDYTSKGRAQAIHDLAESEKESIKGFVDTYQAAINEMNLYEPGTQSFQDAHDRAEDLMNVIKELPPEILMELGIDTDKLDDLLNPEGMANPIEVQADIADAKSKVEQVGETYNTTKDGVESDPINVPTPQTEPFDSGIDGVVAKAGTARDLVEGTPMKLPTPYADSFNDGITQGENRFFSMKDVVENSPIKLPTPEVQDTDTPEITVESNVEPFDSGITQAETRFYSTKDLIEGTPININNGEPPEIPQPKDLPPIEMPVDTGTAESKIKSVRELMGLPIEVPPPNTGAAEGAIGKLEQRVAEIKQKLGSGEATNADTKITVDADTTAAKAKIVALGNTPVKVPIEADPSGIQNAVQSGANGPIRVDVDANVAQAKQQIASLNNMVINVDVQARVANAQNQINGMTGPQIDSTNVSVNYTPNVGALPNSFPPITRIVNYIAQLAALPSSFPNITRWVVYKKTGDIDVNGTAHANGTAQASGTAHASGNWGTAPGGTTLVGELGREIVVDPRTGSWYTVGDEGAEFTDIAPGSIVFNHKQTEALFKYGKVAGRGRALASGTAMAGGSTDSFDNGRIPLSATAALDIELNVNDKDLEKKLEKQLSEMSDKLEYILGQYEHKIFLIEKHAINGFTEEDTRNVIAIYKKMMDEVHAQADKARAKGLSDNSKTITELSKKWFEYRDAITEAITDYYEGLISQTQNAVKLLDFQTGELQNKFHNRTEMVYKQVDAVSTATKEVADELQKLGQGGSVNLLKRPVIDASILRDVGWDDAGEGKATVFSSTFSNEAGTKAINFTPIIVDENGRFVDALEPDALWDYAEEVIAGTREDDLHLQIGAEFNGEDAIQQAELAAERVHELHEKYFLPPPKRTISYWEFSDDGNYDAILETLDEVIEKQREIQRVAHEGADEMRASGKGETSEEIRKFKDDWEDASEAIVQAITTAYDAITGDLESRITLTENWLDNATKGIGNGGKADFDKVKKYSDDIYDYYTQMQTAIHDEADRLRALGYSDTSEEVSKLSDLWWDYEEKRKTAAINAWKEIVDTAKDATDEIAGMYDTLKQAAKEYSSMGGYLTLDTLEKLLAMEPKYMQMLKDENGLWVIDEENVKKATAAKMEDLAITNALAYVDRLRLALESKSTEQLNDLLWVTQDAADSTWQLVYAQLAMLDLSDDQYDAALHNINAIRSMAHAAIEGIGKESDEYKKNLQDMKDGLDDLIKYVMDMLKHKIDEQVDSLEDMKDKYGDIIDEKKKSLDLTKKENDYQKSLGKKVKELAKIQAQIESLRFDTSREAQAKIAKLEQDRADLQEEIAEDQADRAQELTEKALDENLKAYEDEKDDEIEVLKKSISSEEKLYRLATDYMQNHWSTLYGELIDWNTEYGSVLNSEIDEAWENASKAVDRYGSVLEAIIATTKELKTLTESIDFNVVGKSNNADYEEEARAIKAGTNSNSGAASSIMSKINTMQENSNLYKNDARGNGSIANGSDNQKNLAKENERLASEIESMLPSGYRVFRESNGVWYYQKSGQAAMPLYSLSEAELLRLFASQNAVKTIEKKFTGKKLEKHHVGGVAGNKPTVKQDEVFTLLEKGEAIFTKDQQSSLMRILDFSKAIAGKFDSIAMSGANFLTGQMKDLAQSSMTPAYAGASNISYDINVPVQIFPAQKMDEGEIKSLTSKISDYTIKTINNDMSRRGINGGMKRF